MCEPRNALASEVFFTGCYEPQETTLLLSLLRSGSVFVDVGAHWGYFTLLAAARVGTGGKVVAIEADPRIYQQLRRNLSLNPVPWVVALHLAASDGSGVLTLQGYDPAQNNWGISRIVPEADAVQGFRVAGQAVDEVLDCQNIGTVDLLKMDIEGGEWLAPEVRRSGALISA